MARKKKTEPADVLDQLEAQGDEFAEWVQRNIRPLIGLLVGSLIAAGAYGAHNSWTQGQEAEASVAFSKVLGTYLTELGGSATSVDLPELANPEAGKAVRAEYRGLFREVATEHAGTAAAALAWIQIADVQVEEDDREGALETLHEALGSVDQPGLRAIIQERMAQSHEAAGRWAEAAEAHAAAGQISDFALRWRALADAARCHAQSGNEDRARALFDQIEAAAPSYALPDHIHELRRDLRARAAS